MNTVAIIQARMGSGRLPGKAMEDIAGRTVLGWVIWRTMKVRGIDEIMVATTTSPQDDVIETYCDSYGLYCFRGSEDDVLDRYARAAEEVKATHVLRITADCPLLCYEVNSQIVEAMHKNERAYVSCSTRSNGFVQEAFTADALARADAAATEPGDREHVVPYMIRHLRTLFLRSEVDLGAERWCVDTPNDLELLRAMASRVPRLFDQPARELVAL